MIVVIIHIYISNEVVFEATREKKKENSKSNDINEIPLNATEKK